MSRNANHTYSSVHPRLRVMMDDDMMRDVLADVGAMRTAIDLELWASWILGQTWKQRVREPMYQEIDWMLVVGAPMVSMIQRIGGARARKALTAVSMLERGALGSWAGAVALGLSGARTPAWMQDIACARFTRASSLVSLGTGEVIAFDLARPDEPVLTVAVCIDHREIGHAYRIDLLDPFERSDDLDPCDGLQPADLPAAARRVCDAISRTDREPNPIVDPGFADLRAFVLARAIDVAATPVTTASCTPR